jgi:hypothetical protein
MTATTPITTPFNARTSLANRAARRPSVGRAALRDGSHDLR